MILGLLILGGLVVAVAAFILIRRKDKGEL
jgi:hypothetical protein